MAVRGCSITVLAAHGNRGARPAPSRFSAFVRVSCLALAALWPPLLGAAADRAGPDAALGERIYNEGRLPSGEPLLATTQGDITFRGTQFSCISCHRRSGYGSSEGGIYVSPITGPTLFRPSELDRADLFKKLFKETQPSTFRSRIRSPRMRPAYSEDTLARALRDGVDPTGRALDPLMPRYEMNDADVANLTAYLKTLSARPDPGVDDKNIYFATIVAGASEPDKRAAMLATLRKFMAWMNYDTLGDTRNPNFSPNYRSDFIKAYRYWNLEVWDLAGDPETWRAQLAAYYAERPVFAVISGLVEGPWQPIHHFCEEQKLPCLFPHTQLPVTGDEGVYSFHLTRGLTLEAEVIGRYLLADGAAGPQTTVVTLHDAGPSGRIPADALAGMLGGDGRFRVERQSASNQAELQDALDGLAKRSPPVDVLVVWPGDHTRSLLEGLATGPVAAKRIFLPYEALEFAPDPLPDELERRLYFSHPYDLPSAYHPRSFRVRGWMRARRVALTDWRLQFDTYYALTMVQFGLEHIVDNFSRDYFLEYIEHEAENALNPGTYPHLSLGPGQRFASKGAYIVKLSHDPKQRIESASEWIVP